MQCKSSSYLEINCGHIEGSQRPADAHHGGDEHAREPDACGQGRAGARRERFGFPAGCIVDLDVKMTILNSKPRTPTRRPALEALNTRCGLIGIGKI